MSWKRQALSHSCPSAVPSLLVAAALLSRAYPAKQPRSLDPCLGKSPPVSGITISSPGHRGAGPRCGREGQRLLHHKEEALASSLPISFSHCIKPRSLPFISRFARPHRPVALRRLGRTGRGAGEPRGGARSRPGLPACGTPGGRMRGGGRIRNRRDGEEGEDQGEEDSERGKRRWKGTRR